MERLAAELKNRPIIAEEIPALVFTATKKFSQCEHAYKARRLPL